MTRDSGTAPIHFDGAIDMHCHFGPEPLVEKLAKHPHAVDPIEAAQEAFAAGMRAVVLKAHEFPSTAVADLANKAVPDVRSIAGMCCDHPVGGINPQAVETALRAGARVIWLPTLSSVSNRPAAVAAAFGVSEGIAVLDPDGELLPEVRAVMDLVAAYDAVLATGHITVDEHYAVAREFGRRGRLVVTHAMHASAGPGLSVDQTAELADLGAVIEFCAHTCMGKPSTFDQVIAAIARIGADQAIVSTDYGWTDSLPHPAAGLKGYVNSLWDAGVDEQDLRVMAGSVPARLLSLD
ncbi:DUF6282 family protein [Gordonia sp. HY285]|uniref:DUF6282 family protein n=1 Tax=Gordonia liuliyuniae TaxID=2911517 RepID=A0ABS9ITM8_9ACTN|nr:DUF6282 family protein [Gordonia liuliyuniae]MCF8588930.1 DUF6282 family protein [Gordonia liuliyuniae]MCF8609189.1 DUF6282 family protein [Gordonia liuliyuniae]